MKNIAVVFVMLLTLGLMSCEKEGPAGPAGPAGPTGPAGPAGTTIVDIDSVDIQTSDWILVSGGNYKFNLTNSAITQEIMNIGMVSLYQKDYTYPTNPNAWYAMPNVVAGGSGFRYSYTLSSITIYADNYPTGVPRPMRFKTIILK